MSAAKGDPQNKGKEFRDRIRAQRNQRPYEEIKFVKYELSKEEQALCKAWQCRPEEALGMIEGLVGQGYKCTLRYDDYSSSAAAWLQNPDTEHINYGLILSGRGSTVFKALKQVLYKHFEVMSEDWNAYETPNKWLIDD